MVIEENNKLLITIKSLRVENKQRTKYKKLKKTNKPFWKVILKLTNTHWHDSVEMDRSTDRLIDTSNMRTKVSIIISRQPQTNAYLFVPDIFTLSTWWLFFVYFLFCSLQFLLFISICICPFPKGNQMDYGKRNMTWRGWECR